METIWFPSPFLLQLHTMEILSFFKYGHQWKDSSQWGYGCRSWKFSYNTLLCQISLYTLLMHMNAIRRGFKAFQYQIIAATDKEFSHIFDSCLNWYHKNQILKNSKKALHYMARLVTLKTKWPYGYKLWFEIGQNPRFPEVFE